MRLAGTLAPLFAVLAMGACAPVPGPSTIGAFDVPAACPVSASGFQANGGLARSRAALEAGTLTILAVGSSSIEGVGASQPVLGYVPLVEAGLREAFPEARITVINRGIGGETTADTVNRLQTEIDAARPHLVIWQLGTNDMLRDLTLARVVSDFDRGRDILDAAGVDVVLIDPQRLPEDTDNDGFRGRNSLLAGVSGTIAYLGTREGYAVDPRFGPMSGWAGLQGGGVGPDDLHLNDAGYACWAANTVAGLGHALR
ncbi:MAG: SGNH/GDSL hydrolase family protein [Brevundimonas sp.]|uniref:SGNH/GDSL hydrolase family protein n=1 Tax=Brevundimonas sp. TaxID=1871086 RepID=UPI003002A717